MTKRLTFTDFLQRSTEKHDDKYIYDRVQYKNLYTKVEIYCKACKKYFWQIAGNHMDGCGCSECADRDRHKRNPRTLTEEQFIKRAKEVHGDRYDYSQVEYYNNRTNIKIYCKECKRYFLQSPMKHLFGHGCRNCNISQKEYIIKQFLIKNGISFEREKTFKDCRDILPLRFDFYLPEKNLCIEYQGKQHYELDSHLFRYKDPVRAKLELEKQQYRDEIKRRYCTDNNIDLLEIAYWQDIEKVLTEILLKDK